jgi:hypothetical protein
LFESDIGLPLEVRSCDARLDDSALGLRGGSGDPVRSITSRCCNISRFKFWSAVEMIGYSSGFKILSHWSSKFGIRCFNWSSLSLGICSSLLIRFRTLQILVLTRTALGKFEMSSSLLKKENISSISLSFGGARPVLRSRL